MNAAAIESPRRASSPDTRDKPGDVTTIWRDGTVTRATVAGRVFAIAAIAPLTDSYAHAAAGQTGVDATTSPRPTPRAGPQKP